MLAKYLTWILAGLFVLLGAPILLTENAAWQQTWAGLSTLCLGAFAVSMVRDALVTGQIRLQYSVVRLAHQPRLFWAAVVLVATAGVGVLVAGLWLLFIKS